MYHLGGIYMIDFFVLDEQIENISHKNSEKCIKEAVQCYYNGNYRASVSVLYTAIIFDLLQKVIELSEIYGDKSATGIIETIKNFQKNNPKSPEWETVLIEEIEKKTHLITFYEKNTLLQIKQERNYAAHPIISFDSDNSVKLKSITKETTKDLIRKAFEIVFLKDTILAKDIVNDIIKDANEYYDIMKEEGFKKFLETRYFKYMTSYRKEKLFKVLWKFVFILDNEDCNVNRESNYHTLVALFDNSYKQLLELIKKDNMLFYGNLEVENLNSFAKKNNLDINRSSIEYFKKINRIYFFIKFIEKYPEIYKELNDYAKNILEKSAYNMYTNLDVLSCKLYNLKENQIILFYEQIKLNSKLLFLSENATVHFDSILKMIKNYMKVNANGFTLLDNYIIFNYKELNELFEQSDKLGCESQFKEFILKYCLDAQRFCQADFLFEILIKYVRLFKEEDFFTILARMEENSQYYDNKNKTIYLEKICSIYKEKYDKELLISEEEKIIYRRLTSYTNKSKGGFNIKESLDIFEQRINTFTEWRILDIFENIMRNQPSLKLSSEKYPQIFSNASEYCKKTYFTI